MTQINSHTPVFKNIIKYQSIIAAASIAGLALYGSIFQSSEAKQISVSRCRNDYIMCANNAELIHNHQAVSNAISSCKLSLNEHLKDSVSSFLQSQFTSAAEGEDFVKTGVVVLFINQLKYDGVVGVKCSYDLKTKRVIESKRST